MDDNLISIELDTLLYDNGFKTRAIDKIGKKFRVNLLLVGYLKRNRVKLPTQSMVQKWFRDIHNIDIEIYCNHKKYSFLLIKCNHEAVIWKEGSPIEYSKYEEALENALIKAISLLKFVGLK